MTDKAEVGVGLSNEIYKEVPAGQKKNKKTDRKPVEKNLVGEVKRYTNTHQQNVRCWNPTRLSINSGLTCRYLQ